jgi:hypothetical protein
MAYTQKINYHKTRSFSQKINVTIEFVRQNISIIVKSVLLVLGPMAILAGLLFSQYIGFLFSTLEQGEIEAAQDPISFLLNPSYVGFIILAIFSSLLNFAIMFNIMRLYQLRYPEPITVTEVLNTSWRDAFILLGLGLVSWFVIMAGFIALIIPGIYLIIVLSLALPALFFERQGVFSAIGRSFGLIKQKWWSTFGLMIVISFMMNAVSFIFIIPFYVFYSMGMLTMLDGTGSGMDVQSLGYQAGMTISVIIMFLGNFIAYCLPIVAISFQYFNLVERQQSVGLLADIDKLPVE